MAEKVLETEIKRGEGWIYFCKGNPVEVWKAKMGRKKKLGPENKGE